MKPDLKDTIAHTMRGNCRRLSCGLAAVMLAASLPSVSSAAGINISDVDLLKSDGITARTYDGSPIDFDGDGNADIVVAANQGGARDSVVYLGNGDGTFGPRLELSDDFASEAAVADIDGDGNLDIVLGIRDNPDLYYLGNGDGTFDPGVAIDPATTTRTLSVEIGDIDNDNDLDIVIGNGRAGGVNGNPAQSNRYYTNTLTGGVFGFDPGVEISADADVTRSILLVDLDNDGLLDVLAANDSTEPNANRYYINTTIGPLVSFAAGVDFGPADDETDQLAAGDLDNDGDQDVVSLNNRQPIRFHLNDGGSLGAAQDVSADLNRVSAGVLVDFDGDGDLDLATANLDSTAPNETAVNLLFMNQFVESGSVTFGAPLNISDDADKSRDIDSVDLNNDGLPDIVVANESTEDRAYLNNGTSDPFAENEPPVFTSNGPTGATQGVVYTYNVTTSDAEGDPVTISGDTVPAWLTLTDNGDGTATLTGTPNAPEIGDHDVVLSADDATNGTKQSYTITVVAAGGGNTAPTFTSNPVTDATEDEAYTYNIQTNDAEGDPLAITGPTVPAWLTLTDNGDGTATLTGTPGAADVGDHNVSLQVSDGAENTTQDFTITVDPVVGNQKPQFDSTPVTQATVGQAYTYDIQVSDPDGDAPLVITAPTIPGWLTLTDNGDGTGTLTGTPAAGDEGDNDVALNVEDPSGAKKAQVFTIVVQGAGADTTPPVITLIGPANVTVNVGDTYADQGATAEDDVDGDITSEIVVNNSVNTSIAGTYQVTYDVTDSAGNAADTVTRTVVVRNPPSTGGGGGGGAFGMLSLLGLLAVGAMRRRRLA